MSSEQPLSDLRSAWEYRRVFVLPSKLSRRSPSGRSPATSGDELVRCIQDLEQQQTGGWQVLRLQVAEDERGRVWLDTAVKRPLKDNVPDAVPDAPVPSLRPSAPPSRNDSRRVGQGRLSLVGRREPFPAGLVPAGF